MMKNTKAESKNHSETLEKMEELMGNWWEIAPSLPGIAWPCMSFQAIDLSEFPGVNHKKENFCALVCVCTHEDTTVEADRGELRRVQRVACVTTSVCKLTDK